MGGRDLIEARKRAPAVKRAMLFLDPKPTGDLFSDRGELVASMPSEADWGCADLRGVAGLAVFLVRCDETPQATAIEAAQACVRCGALFAVVMHQRVYPLIGLKLWPEADVTADGVEMLEAA